MKATIRDVGALSALKPLEVVSYLRSTGWSAGREVSSRWSQWTLEFDETETFEIAVPLTHSFRDFAARMQEVLQTLEAVEEPLTA